MRTEYEKQMGRFLFGIVIFIILYILTFIVYGLTAFNR